MKKKYLVVLFALILTLAFTACRAEEEVTPEPGTDHTYKDLMKPFNELTPANRIVIIQNTLNFGMTGFYTEETKPETKTISYKGKDTKAYPISYTLDFLKNEIKGDVTVTDTEGKKLIFSAKDFSAMYAIADFTSGDPVILYNPDTNKETTLASAITSEGEGIYSVTADTAHNTADIMKACGWKEDVTYRLVATDQFYIPVEPEYLKAGELRGTLSGAVNASFQGMTIASGKLNDPVYFEQIPKEDQ